MRREIPSTAALISFESAVRYESLIRAVEELSLTQSTIYRQITMLEELLGIELFRRLRHGIKLTEAELPYSQRVMVRLDAVECDILAVVGHQDGDAIELVVVPTFGTQRLLLRLKRFQWLHPEVTTNLTNRIRPFLFADTRFDAALYFGGADWSGAISHFLMCEDPVPVYSPELLGGRRTLGAEQVVELPLIQQGIRPYAWRQRLHSQGPNVAHGMSGSCYELFSMLAQAAMYGMGVALIPPLLIQDELADRRLIVPIQYAYSSENVYYLITPERRIESAALNVFHDWLMKEARQYRETNRLG